MLRRILKESLIVSGITLIFLVISATIGISKNTPHAPPPAKAAYETERETEDLRFDGWPVEKCEDVKTAPLVD
jgi:hypothetical protein